MRRVDLFAMGACVLFVCLVGCGDDDGNTAGTAGSNGGTGGGSDDAGGSGGSGSICHASPSPDPTLPVITDVDPDQVARAAAVIGSCLPDDGADRNAIHLWDAPYAAPYSYYRTLTQVQCLADANCGCEALDRCLGIAVRPEAEACTDGCNGDVWEICNGNGTNFHVDCARVGLACDDALGCVGGATVPCDETTPPSCDEAGRPTRCDRGGVVRGPTCADLGLTCSEGICIGAGAECLENADPDVTSFRGATCTGNTLHACVGMHLHDVDCATLGPFTCQTFGNSAFCGLGNECDPAEHGLHSSSDAPRCEGTDLVYCHLGRLERIDCLALAFTGCNIDRATDDFGCTPGIDTDP